MPALGSFLKIKLITNERKKIVLLFCIALFAVQLDAQTDYNSFYVKSQKNSNTGMYVLGSWALLNMASGAYGMSTQSGSSKYFYWMTAQHWAAYSGYNGINVADTFTHYTFVFDMAETDNNARMVFDLGTSNVDFTITDIKLEEIVLVPQPTQKK